MSLSMPVFHDLPVCYLSNYRDDFPKLEYKHLGDSGFDLRSMDEDFALLPGRSCAFRTGLAFAVPACCELQIRSRSGLARHSGIIVVNSPGTVDSSYRGEVIVTLHNLSGDVYVVRTGMRIAQAVLAPVYRARFYPVETLDETSRGAGGHGSTGIS